MLGSVLSLITLRPSDPWIFVPALILAWLAFLYVAYYHEGSQVEKWVFRIAVTVVLGFLAYRNYTTAVTITPSTVSFDQNGELQSFTLSNNTDFSLHSVLVVLRTKEPNGSPTPFRLVIEQSQLKPLGIQSDDPDIIAADMTGAFGHDEGGRQCVLVYAYHLVPHESRVFSLLLPPLSDSSPHGGVPGNLSIEGPLSITVTSEIESRDYSGLPLRKNGGIVLIPVRTTESGLIIEGFLPCFIETKSAAACESRSAVKNTKPLPKGTYYIGFSSWKQP